MDFESEGGEVNKDSLKNVDGCDINGYAPNVWENDIKTLRRVK